MSSSDQIMLDSPAQTPDAKSQQQPVLRGGGGSSIMEPGVPTDIAMMIERQGDYDSQPCVPGSWDNKQWRDELQAVSNKLQHPTFKRANLRDPMSKPLVTKPPGLTAELEQRLRKCFEEAVARQEE